MAAMGIRVVGVWIAVWIAAAAAQNVVTVLCGSLFDPRTGAVRTNQVVTIVDGFVANVTAYDDDRAASNLLDADLLVDLSDKFVLPGFVDAHTHLFLRPYNVVEWRDQVTRESVPQRTLRAAMYAKMTIEAGFTTVRDLGTEGALDADLDLKRAIAEGWVAGPRMFITSRAIVSTGGYEPKGYNEHIYVGAETADGVEEMRKVARRQLNHGGADWLKLYCDYSRYQGQYAPLFTIDEIRTAVEEAAEVGARVAAHAKYPTAILRAVEAGVKSIEHGEFATDEALIAMRDQGVAYAPTLAIYEAITQFEPDNEEAAASFERLKNTVARALALGVNVVVGSDVGGVENGQNMREVELLVECGMTRAQALSAATFGSGALVSTRLPIGLLEGGYVGDLVALEGNPLTDWTALRRVRFVMKDGAVFRDDDGAASPLPKAVGSIRRGL